MTDISDKDYCLARIRQKLKEDGVKLWEAPFYVNNQTSDSSFEVRFDHFYFYINNKNLERLLC